MLVYDSPYTIQKSEFLFCAMKHLIRAQSNRFLLVVFFLPAYIIYIIWFRTDSFFFLCFVFRCYNLYCDRACALASSEVLIMDVHCLICDATFAAHVWHH